MKNNSRVPTGAETRPNNRVAEGEATGHYHDATAPDAAVLNFKGGIILAAPRGTLLTHQEHGTVPVAPNVYDRIIVREYDHLKEEARNVVD